MKRISLKIETFQKKPEEPDDSWGSWNDEEKDDKPEDLSNYEPIVVDGGVDALDIQSWMRVRDDRVAVVMKNSAVLSVVGTLEEFERKLEEVGL